MLLLLLISSCRSTSQSDNYTNTISDSLSRREIEMSHHCQRPGPICTGANATGTIHTRQRYVVCHSFRKRYRNMCQSSSKRCMCETGTIECCVPLNALGREVSQDCANARVVCQQHVCDSENACERLYPIHDASETTHELLISGPEHFWINIVNIVFGWVVVVGQHVSTL